MLAWFACLDVALAVRCYQEAWVVPWCTDEVVYLCAHGVWVLEGAVYGALAELADPLVAVEDQEPYLLLVPGRAAALAVRSLPGALCGGRHARSVVPPCLALCAHGRG